MNITPKLRLLGNCLECGVFFAKILQNHCEKEMACALLKEDLRSVESNQ